MASTQALVLRPTEPKACAGGKLQTSNFLDIPVELRHQIYRELLPDMKVLASLQQVSAQIRAEVIDILVTDTPAPRLTMQIDLVGVSKVRLFFLGRWYKISLSSKHPVSTLVLHHARVWERFNRFDVDVSSVETAHSSRKTQDTSLNFYKFTIFLHGIVARLAAGVCKSVSVTFKESPPTHLRTPTDFDQIFAPLAMMPLGTTISLEGFGSVREERFIELVRQGGSMSQLLKWLDFKEKLLDSIRVLREANKESPGARLLKRMLWATERAGINPLTAVSTRQLTDTIKSIGSAMRTAMEREMIQWPKSRPTSNEPR